MLTSSFLPVAKILFIMASSTDVRKQVEIEPLWLEHLELEFDKDYMSKLRSFLQLEKSKHVIYPPFKDTFRAFNETPFDQVKVVILGQDPYHGPGQAHGLCFSVPEGIKAPPSLVNIFKEIKDSLAIDVPSHGCLDSWAKQGVFLLNSSLSVRAHQAASHAGQGWEQFTDKVIEILNEKRENLVFMLWGSYARSKGKTIDKERHLVLEAPHPSPLSAHRGFLGCGHFKKTNEFLEKKGINVIDWKL